MKHPTIVAITAVLLTANVTVLADGAFGQAKPQESYDVERVNAANQVFIAAIAGRDVHAMDKAWAHEPYATFIGPLSTTVVVGWEGVRKAWQMRFNQFDRVPIPRAETHVLITARL